MDMLIISWSFKLGFIHKTGMTIHKNSIHK
jgi:hypothetical protein